MMKYLVFASLVAGLTVALACGPFFEVAVFSYKKHPDFPRTAFLEGELGILQPTYARSYLVLAYRYLSGTGLSAGEKEQVRDYWKDRATDDWDKTGTNWLERWMEARNRIAGRRLEWPGRVSGGPFGYDRETHSFYLNCAEDAFRTAYRALEGRVRRFGAGNRAVREWLQAQDAVFANCSSEEPTIPRPAGADLPPLIRADRAYQIAAAHFYAGQYQQAIASFRSIAADRTSPWRQIAPYLVVRAMVREASVREDWEAFQQAGREARRVLANPDLRYVHGMTRVLLRRAAVLSDDEEYFLGLAADLAQKGREGSLREELWEFTTMFDHFLGENRWGYKNSGWKVDLRVMRRHDLIDWIYTFQSQDSGDVEHAVARWRKTRSLPWLVAALFKVDAGNPSGRELLDASAGVAPGTPAYLTVAYHRYRLMIASGAAREARDGLDELLAGRVVPLPKSSVNQLRGLRMLAAPTLSEFLRFAQRFPVMGTWNDNPGQVPRSREALPRFDRKLVRLDRDSTRILNERTPLRMLLAAARDPEVPAHLRREFALTTFTRALLLENDRGSGEAAQLLRAVMPEAARFLQPLHQEADAPGRHFAGLFLVLHHPESRPYLVSNLGRQAPNGKIDNYRDNWWCAMDLKTDLDARAFYDAGWGSSRPREAAFDPAFFSEADRSEAKAEFERLVKTRSAPNYLGTRVLKYAEAHPQDPRVPEALHLAVRTGRFGCVDKDAWKATRAAFLFLHRRYPRSPWTQKTPTWFKNWFTTDTP